MLLFTSALYLLALRGNEKRTHVQDDLLVTSRRSFVAKAVTNLLIIEATTPCSPSFAIAAEESLGTVRVMLRSPQDRLGLELYEVDIGSPPRRVLAIRGNSGSTSSIQGLQAGMVLKDYASLET